MSEFKGTKGSEWVVETSYDEKYKQTIFNISTDTREGLAVCFSGGDHFKEEQLANAKLISTAPELLEALQELIDLMESIIEGDYKPDSFTTQYAKTVINKALGEN